MVEKYIAVIGDMVDSRGVNRVSSHHALTDSLARVDAGSVQSLHPTVGDEIQGVFATIGDAFRAMHQCRIELMIRGADIRWGIGYGEIVTIDPKLDIQDGSGWWNAREALNQLVSVEEKAGWSNIRTYFYMEEKERSSFGQWILPLSHMIDVHMTRLNPSTSTTLRGVLRGDSNQQVARRLKISPAANSMRVNDNDLRPLAAAMKSLWELP
ncbi:SatD family protein [Arcanobacterium haemolyticum]